MKQIHQKTVYLSDIVNTQYTTPKAVQLEILRSYDQSVINLKNPNSKNYFNLCDYKKSKSNVYKE